MFNSEDLSVTLSTLLSIKKRQKIKIENEIREKSSLIKETEKKLSDAKTDLKRLNESHLEISHFNEFFNVYSPFIDLLCSIEKLKTIRNLIAIEKDKVFELTSLIETKKNELYVLNVNIKKINKKIEKYDIVLDHGVN